MQDTDFHMISALRGKYSPATTGVVTDAEASLIAETLALRDRTDIELQNVRDMSVMLYGQWSSAAMADGCAGTAMSIMDAMSAITAVIDREKCRRGLEV